MHELSIASGILEIVTDRLREAGGDRVTAVTVRVGRLASVQEEPLRMAFEAVSEGTPLDGADLRVVAVPLRVHCPRCGIERDLPGIGRLACPACGTPTGDLRGGGELEIESIELEAGVA